MRRGYIDEVLEQRGYKRNVRLSVPSFSEVTSDLLDAGYIVTLPNQVALTLAKGSSATIQSLPFELPMFNYYLFWHRRFNNNQRNVWIRELIENTFQTKTVPV